MEDYEPLVKPEDLTGFPGAPFSESAVNAAAMSVRTETGWHIAPQVTETLEVETGCSRVALLDTMHVVEVIAVRDADNGRELTDWRFSRAGTLARKAGVWPEVIEVELTHGYEKCPEDLLPIIAERSQRSKWGMVAQENIGARSVSLRQNYDPTSTQVLARYSLPPRP